MAASSVEFDVPAPMRDGTLLRANVYRPAGEGPWPVLLNRSPYGKDLPGANGVLDAVQATRRGYMVAIQDTRGRFASEGQWEPFRGEAEDGYDTVEWAARLPGANGRVGMYGASYHGSTQWQAAIQQAPALRAIAPFITWSEPLDGTLARGGALELGISAPWALLQGLNQLMRRHAGQPAALGPAIAELVSDFDRLATETYWNLPAGDFAPVRRHGIGEISGVAALADPAAADHMRVAGHHHRVNVPAYNVGGWYDIFLRGTLDNFTALRRLGVPTKVLIGPWAHVVYANPIGELNFGFGAQIAFIDLRADFMSMQLRWFDHWLRDLDTGIMAEPPVRLFVMGINRWRDEPDWPLARAVRTDFHLRAGGGLTEVPPASDEEPDRFTYDPADPVLTRGGALLMTPEFRPGPMDQGAVEARGDVLVYTTEPLARDLEVTGPVTARLCAATSAPSTDWVVRLCDVWPDGRSFNLTDGILRVRGEPGVAAEHEIDLWATSNVFRAGHRIRLQVTSSCFPRWDRNLNTGEPPELGTRMQAARQTVFHDSARASRLLLPVVPD
ncbi:MAG: CocE/NonD family hydrolase [Candidatus Dormibacteraeota bacterium]|nr:CocE/NonD family hydrolase [Candidatus Dormibacteraeota bacterium]